MDPLSKSAASSQEDAADRSLVDDLHGIVDDGLAYVQAELEFQKARAAYGVGSVKSIALYGVIAVVLLLLALIGLTVGLIFSLAPLITPFGATAAVVVAELLLAYLCLKVASGRARRMMGELSPGGARS